MTTVLMRTFAMIGLAGFLLACPVIKDDLSCEGDSDCTAGLRCSAAGRCELERFLVDAAQVELDASEDAGAGQDAHRAPDAGPHDAQARDAQSDDRTVPGDASELDTGAVEDAHIRLDAATDLDAALPGDAGATVDSGPGVDGAVADAAISDAALSRDALVVDAEPAHDASQPDAWVGDAAPPLCLVDGLCDVSAGETQHNCADCRFTKVAVSQSMFDDSTCAIRQDGTLWCWGQNNYGLLGVGRQGTAVDVTDRALPTQVTGLGNVRDVSVGRNACAATGSGAVYCWGRNDNYQLGLGNNVGPRTCSGVLGDEACADYPEQVPGLSNIADVEVGSLATCAVDGNQEIRCWGHNQWGAVGASSSDTCLYDQDCAQQPIKLSITGVSEVQLGQDFGCAAHWADLSYKLACWGDDSAFQIPGTPSDTCPVAQPCARTPMQVRSSPTPIIYAVTSNQGCWIDGDAIACWGAGYLGALGSGTENDQSLPTAVQGLPAGFRPESLVAGGFAACTVGLVPQGSAIRTYCWGANEFGQLATGALGPDTCSDDLCALSPQQMRMPDGVVKFTQMDLGWDHACGIADNGLLYCWGRNDSGQLGTGDDLSTQRLTPTLVAY